MESIHISKGSALIRRKVVEVGINEFVRSPGYNNKVLDFES